MSTEFVRYFKWLDDLRESGEMNMFGAAPYLADAFGLDKSAARKILQQWAKTFDPEKPAEDRAALADTD